MNYILNKNVVNLFTQFDKKEVMLGFIKKHPSMFNDILMASLNTDHKKAWRAALLLGHLIKKNDKRMVPFVMHFIELLPKISHDGHQRQVLIILDKMELTEKQNGYLFNNSLSIWEAVQKIPSTRIFAFKTMLKISNSFPQLKAELLLFTTNYYTQTLSPGIKVSFKKMTAKL